MKNEKHERDMTPEEKKAALDDAANELSNEVYAATSIIERLEAKGLLLGNGHHIRQKLADDAVRMLRERTK